MSAGKPVSSPPSSIEENSYILVQLKGSDDLRVVSDIARELVSIPGVSAASGTTGIFDLLVKISMDKERTEKLLSDLRGKEQVEFASAFQVNSVHIPGTGLPNFRPRRKAPIGTEQVQATVLPSD